MRYCATVGTAILAFLLFIGTAPGLADTYISVLDGNAALSYDANPNGVYPDPDGYGDFCLLTGGYVITTDGFPPPEDGPFDWYLDPFVSGTGLLIGQIPIEILINDYGMFAAVGGEPVIDATWEEMGYLYIPGAGIYMTTMVTPESFFPPDPDRLCGFYDYDHDLDGQIDIDLEITGAGGVHDVTGHIYRSATWMGLQGTGLPEAFADWLEAILPGIPPDLLDQIRQIDLSPLIDLELLIGYFGGPIPGYDAVLEGPVMFTLFVTNEPISAAEATTWGKVKALYR